VIKRGWPVLVVARTVPAAGDLRTKAIYAAVRESIASMHRVDAEQDSEHHFEIVHASIQPSHLHFLVETHDRYALGAACSRCSLARAPDQRRAQTE
jgi:REP element-mobilizing transposase RayT